jgi:hypothetical protein
MNYNDMSLDEVWKKLRPLAAVEFAMELGLIGHDLDDVKSVPALEMKRICDNVDAYNRDTFDRIKLWDHPELFPAAAGKTENQPS